MLGTQEILLIVGAGILLFGAKKIPEIARGLGRSMTEFKEGMREDGSKKTDTDKSKKSESRKGLGGDSADDSGDVG